MRSKQKSYELRVTSYELNRGLTLLELLIVLTIIGIASAIAGAVLYRSLGDLKLKSTAKEVAASLRYARSQAVSEKRIYSFSLDPENRVYHIFAYPSPSINNLEGRSYSSPHRGEDRTDESKSISKTLPEGIFLVSKERINIFFYPLGNSTGGNLALVNEKGSTWDIEIEPSTGRVKIEKVKS